MDYNNTKVVNLKALVKERGLQGYSKLRKAELITFLQNNLQPSTSTPRPDTQTRPPRPIRPPLPPLQSVRYRPDRPRQPELEERPVKSTTFKPYQLKPKRDFHRTSCRTVFFKPKTDQAYEEKAR